MKTRSKRCTVPFCKKKMYVRCVNPGCAGCVCALCFTHSLRATVDSHLLDPNLVWKCCICREALFFDNTQLSAGETGILKSAIVSENNPVVVPHCTQDDEDVCILLPKRCATECTGCERCSVSIFLPQ